MTDEDRIVVISDARYTNPGTGETTTSNKYHIPGVKCVRDSSPHRLEVPESMALAFGRTLCGTCAHIIKRREVAGMIEARLAGVLDTDFWDTLVSLLPEDIEVRFFWHEPGKSTPRTIWTSKPKEG